jgi:hypothetical protein
MSIPAAWPQILDFFGTPVVIEPSAGQLSSDAGLLPLRQFDQRIGLTRAFAAALDDPRDPGLTEPSFLEMVRSRVYGILAGYADQNDHDTLRADPVFKLLAGRSPDGPNLASQPTLSRFENAISIQSLKRLRDVFLDQFITSFDTPPRHLTFDLDAVDDPAHGCQQLTFWHNYYDQNQYLPLLITCADNDQLVMLSLRHGIAHAALGADDDLAYLVGRLRRGGESENRNKEFKCDLAMDRLSDHRFVANFFRLYLHAAAMNLLVRLRRFIAEPLPALAPQAETASPTSQPGEAAGPADEPCVPVEALTGAARQRHFRLRRQRDPLGEGHPCTWRTLLIKVAAEVVVRTRRIVVRLSSSWPHLGWYLRVCERLGNPLPTPVPDRSG